MPYYTILQNPIYEKITLDELLDNKQVARSVRWNESNTRTFICAPWKTYELYSNEYIFKVKEKLTEFVRAHTDLYEADRHSLYRTFYIPKRTGGKREINAPNPELMDALIELRSILEVDCNALYHTSAYAYIRNRMTVDAVKKHQQNNSHWFLKVDFHDFFGSTNKEFVLKMLGGIVPFDRLTRHGDSELKKAIDLCFLDDKLPQGTPISPMLTNLIMIPIDHKLSKVLRERNLVYTRYADDILISGLQGFNVKEIQDIIRGVLAEFEAPYTFKDEKTRYGSREGSNWNLGVMLNKDNNITVGHRNKKTFRAMLTNFLLDWNSNKPWSLDDIQYMNGLLSYYKMVEPDYFKELIAKINTKHNTNIEKIIKECLKG